MTQIKKKEKQRRGTDCYIRAAETLPPTCSIFMSLSSFLAMSLKSSCLISPSSLVVMNVLVPGSIVRSIT